MHETDVPVVVIGAGPYGLAVAAHLQGRKMPVRVFGDPMSSWRDHMPPGMFLKSTPEASSIAAPVPGYTLADYCRRAGRLPLGPDEPVPIGLFIDYGEWFRCELVPGVEPARVSDLRQDGDDFLIRLDTGEQVSTGNVVVATGLSRFAYVPEPLAALAASDAAVTHSCRYGDLARLAGADVVVVGAGQSALETAVLLHELGSRVRVVARRPVVFADPPDDRRGSRSRAWRRPPSPLGPGWRHVAVSSLPASFRYLPPAVRLRLVARILGPSGAWWLRERFGPGIPVLQRHVVGARRDGAAVKLTLADAGGATSTLTADHVIAATGYRVDVGRLDFLDPALRSAVRRVGGFPRLGPAFESSVPGLSFPGLAAAASFGPLQRFVCGTGFAARRIVAALAAQTPAPVG
ncbi:FAD-dependent oxidoreductase [Actinoplanes sp. NPDC049681]|uniref:FAD-dependent oxidoreductase n=1 Tax=Actinoplanes sp. NPDC049681 TaxID=3363905 RepID=UPI0037B2B633